MLHSSIQKEGKKTKGHKKKKRKRDTQTHTSPEGLVQEGERCSGLRSGADLSLVCETETRTVGVSSIMDSV